MKKTLLCLVALLAIACSLHAQDSLYYFALWKPEHLYRTTGTRQEGIFLHLFRNGQAVDSLLLQTKVYDSLGRLVRQQNFQRNKVRTRFTYFYAGNRPDSMVQEEIWLPATLVHRYRYDNKNNLLLQQTFNGAVQTVQTRYVHNNTGQLLQVFTQLSGAKEYLSLQYTYRPDRLVQQVDHFFPENPHNNYSLLYTYTNGTRTAIRSFQRMNDTKRFIDFIRTYNDRGQLVEEISPPFRRNSWLPPGYHGRVEEEVGRLVYLPNGLLLEAQVSRDSHLVWTEKHIYLQ